MRGYAQGMGRRIVQHLIDTPMELATCDRCKAHVFKCWVSGVSTVVDIAALDGMDDVRRRLMMGRTVYRILDGRKLATFRRDSTKGNGYLADHWCGPGVVGAKPVEVVPVGPPSAPATPGGPLGGFHHPHAPADGSQGHTATFDHARSPAPSSSNPPSRAIRASHPRSDPKPTRCATCREIITVHTPDVWSIEYDGRLVYGQHVAC